MIRWVGTEIVAEGKMDDYRAWFEARDKRLQELRMTRARMYTVSSHAHTGGQPAGKVFFEWPDMTLEEAERIIDGARQKAAEMGFPAGIAVVDASDHLVALKRMDNTGVRGRCLART